MSNLSQKPIISIIAAISEKNRAIGHKNRLLWKIDGDLPRFKKLTTGHPIIMGRITFDTIGRPLPNRTNIIISRSKVVYPEYPDLIIANDIESALNIAKNYDNDEIFIIGGGQIYSAGISYADRLYLTVVHNEPEADTFFPEYSNFTKEIYREEHNEFDPKFTYLTLEK